MARNRRTRKNRASTHESNSEESSTDSSSYDDEGTLSKSKHMLNPQSSMAKRRSKRFGPNSRIAQNTTNGVKRRNWYISVVRWIKTLQMSCGTMTKTLPIRCLDLRRYSRVDREANRLRTNIESNSEIEGAGKVNRFRICTSIFVD